MPKKVDHELRREDVGRAAYLVIAEKGLAAATLREVARKAGMSSALMVHYIKSKDQLLLAAHEYSAKLVRRRMQAIEKKHQGLEAFRRIVWESLPHDKERRGIFKLWLGFWEMAGQDPQVRAKLNAGYRESQERYEFHLRKAQALGELPPNLDIAFCAWSASVFLDGIGVQTLLGDNMISSQMQKKHLDGWIDAALQSPNSLRKAVGAARPKKPSKPKLSRARRP